MVLFKLPKHIEELITAPIPIQKPFSKNFRGKKFNKYNPFHKFYQSPTKKRKKILNPKILKI